MTLEQLQTEITKLQNRNTRVDADKAWERSGIRVGSICILTYFTVAAVLFCIGSKNPLLDACVPVFGFLLSTQSLPAIKDLWVKHYLTKHQPTAIDSGENTKEP